MNNHKRFVLKSFHFQDLQGVIYDNLEEEELHLSIHGIINLLNKVSQEKYNLMKLEKEINQKLDEMKSVIKDDRR